MHPFTTDDVTDVDLHIIFLPLELPRQKLDKGLSALCSAVSMCLFEQLSSILLCRAQPQLDLGDLDC